MLGFMNYSPRTYARSKVIERRRDIRTPYSESIYFATKKQIYEGRLKNLCHRGLCIKTKEIFSEGEIIIVAIPFSAAQNVKYKGEIIWFDHEGFGMKSKCNRCPRDCSYSYGLRQGITEAINSIQF